MNYLDPSEYQQHGLDASLPECWVAASSALIDAHCRRASLGVAQYSQRLRLTAGRNSVRLTYLPLATLPPAVSPIVTARARFAMPRRGESAAELSDFAVDVARAFSLPGEWTSLDPASLDCDVNTGEVTFALHPLGLSFNEAEIVYTAGLAEIPPAVKFACAQLVRNAIATPVLNVRAGVVDNMRLQYFSDTLLDDSVRKWLTPFVAESLAA
jgi:hypothetical protein